jgi:hypothetical protein
MGKWTYETNTLAGTCNTLNPINYYGYTSTNAMTEFSGL